MKRNLWIFALLLAVLLSVSACVGTGSDAGTAETTGTGNPSETTDAVTDGATTEGETDETTAAGTTEAETEEPEEPIERMDFENIDLSPYITLGQYKEIPLRAKKIEATIALHVQFYNGGKYFTKVTGGDRTVKEGDIISVDYTGYLDGEAFEDGAAKDQIITVYEGTGYIPGFASGFIGAKAGEDASFRVSFPEDYHEASLKGKEVTFEFTVHYICEFEPLTDEIAKELSDGAYPTKEAFETYQRNLLIQGELWKTIVENATIIEYPAQQVEYYYRQNRDYYKMYAAYNGVTYEELLTVLGITDADVYEGAKLYVLEDLVYYAILRAENIELTDAEYEARIDSYIQRYKDEFGYTDAQIEASMDAIKDNMLYDMVQELLIAWANVEWQ